MRESDKRALMGGIYIFTFSSEWKANAFLKKYRECPNWPIIEKGKEPNQLRVVAIESVYQQHGNFSNEENTLVENPELIGAESVSFVRDDRLVFLFDANPYESDKQESPPCGSNCENCPIFGNPCRGCPSVYK
ncbi:MAG: hypothetical protein BAJATHORv1_40268 [Candidatus Thorarchaeota archaeon]|nr:MAG: hypothetical protein BAJATHORv1_40268 [Candidatus Thorarchaeota archaeon]